MEDLTDLTIVRKKRSSNIDATSQKSDLIIVDGGKKRRSSFIDIIPKATEQSLIEEELNEIPEEFEISTGLSSQQAKDLLEIHGRNELPEKVIPKWYIFCQQLWQPMPCLIWAAAAIEAAIGNFADMAILLVIQFLNASIGFYEITKAGDAVAALKASLKPSATVYRDAKWQIIDAALLVPGDLVKLASGSAIPADCRVNEGEIEVDQSAMSGESLPVTFYKGGSCKMGSTVVRGEVDATVEFTGSQTFFGKTASMLGQTETISHLQRLLIKFVLVLVIISFTLCLSLLGYLLDKHLNIKIALSYVVTVLVASVPLALELVTNTTLALGSKDLSVKGAIVTRLSAIEDLAGMDMLCSDKTGTLTLNKMVLHEETPLFMEGLTQTSLLRYAAMAAKWDEPPRDALDTLVLGNVDLPSMSTLTQLDFTPFDPTTKRTEGIIRDEAGDIFRVTKGAPHIILKLVCPESETENNPEIQEIRHRCEQAVQAMGSRGIRCLAVARTVQGKDGPWRLMGLLTFLDPPRPDTKETIHRAIAFGVEVKMITGDHLLIARETAKVLEMGTNIENADRLPFLDTETKSAPSNLVENYGSIIRPANGFAQVFPEHKYLVVECLRQMGFKVGMTGDGVNDAPALNRADVGVAVSGATEAARAAADIVLTEEGLSTIVEGIIIARRIFQRLQSFLTYRIAATLQLLCFFFIAVLSLHPSSFVPNPLPSDWDVNDVWPDFFRMPVLLLMLLVLLNDGALISIGYDNATPGKFPEKWRFGRLFFVAGVLASVTLASALILLYLLLDCWNPQGVLYAFGLGKLQYGQIITSIYLNIALSAFLSLFTIRAGEGHFWSSRPANILLVSCGCSLIISTGVSCGWPMSTPDGVPTLGLARHVPKSMAVFVWLYSLVWFLAQDTVKVLVYKLIHRVYPPQSGQSNARIVDHPMDV